MSTKLSKTSDADCVQIHAKLGEIIYTTADFKANAAELSRVISESMRRYLRSVELCENYLKGYYGLKLVSIPDVRDQLRLMALDMLQTSAVDTAGLQDLNER
jgi:hypothetical protein